MSDSVSMSCLGMEPHRRTFTLTELCRDGVDAVAAAMFKWLATGKFDILLGGGGAVVLVLELETNSRWKNSRESSTEELQYKRSRV